MDATVWYRQWHNPDDTLNWLWYKVNVAERILIMCPAWDTCMYCGKDFIAQYDHRIRAKELYCSPECRAAVDKIFEEAI